MVKDIFLNVQDWITLAIYVIQTILRIIFLSIADLAWLRPATVSQLTILVFHANSWMAWLAVPIVFIGENYINLSLVNVYDYKIWNEEIIQGYFLAYPKAMYKKIDSRVPELNKLDQVNIPVLSKLMYQSILPVRFSCIQVESDEPYITSIKTYQVSGGTAIIFLPKLLSIDLEDSTSESTLSKIDIESASLSKFRRVLDIYHEIGHSSNIHDYYRKQSRFSVFLVATMIVSLMLQSSDNLLGLFAIILIFLIFYNWVAKLNDDKDEILKHCEKMADLCALFYLLGILKVNLKMNDQEITLKYRTAIARIVRFWRRTWSKSQPPLRHQYVRDLTRFAQLISQDTSSGFEVLMKFSARLAPPLILKTAVLVVIILSSSQYYIGSISQLIKLGFFWILLPYLLYKVLLKLAYNLKKRCYEHMVQFGYDGDFLDIG